MKIPLAGETLFLNKAAGASGDREGLHDIERAIIDKNARIGDGMSIRSRPEVRDFKSHNCWVRGGITVIPKGAVIPPGTEL